MIQLPKFLLFILFVCPFYSFLYAQGEPQIEEQTRSMSKGSYNALVVDLPQSSYKKVQKMWKKYAKNYRGKLKYDRKTNEYFLDNAEIKDMSDNTIDIIAKITEKGENGSEMTVWFNLGVTYLSSEEHPQRYPIAEAMLSNFSLQVSADWLKELLKIEEAKLEDMNEELTILEKEKVNEEENIKKQEEIIVKAEEDIKDSEKNIEKNLEDQDKQEVVIKDQEKVIEVIKKKLEKLK